MGNFQFQGDLTDIIRGSVGVRDTVGEDDMWLLPPPEDFGDPFTHLRDPLLHDVIGAPISGGFHSADGGSMSIPPENELKIPANIFSTVLQISPPPPDSAAVADNTSKSLQISSPRNTGMKRRRSQAKKVVCIPAPAPAPANSRPSSEVVPSDLRAWRKYGQKPIKGSPYPRGYYRCSSSKGCLARKQVERSRTNPNMLVITYTSEHNHPWPTQRNALAGSTRSKVVTTLGTLVKAEVDCQDFDGSRPRGNKPALPNSNESLFGDLGEMEPDSLFPRGYFGDLYFGTGNSSDE